MALAGAAGHHIAMPLNKTIDSSGDHDERLAVKPRRVPKEDELERHKEAVGVVHPARAVAVGQDIVLEGVDGTDLGEGVDLEDSGQEGLGGIDQEDLEDVGHEVQEDMIQEGQDIGQEVG